MIKKKLEVTIIDYKMGNIKSLENAFKYLNVNIVISDEAKKISKSSVAILPGVGSFYKAMETIKKKNIDKAIFELLKKGNYLFCICLGMQLLGTSSSEDKFTQGLGIIKNKVTKFDYKKIKLKIPHAGFNSVKVNNGNKLFEGIKDKSDFYFIHSYKMTPDYQNKNIDSFGTTTYGDEFLSYINIDNVFATQFHPEKSQSNGIKLLGNFLKLI